ncbi:MAG: glutathione-dependent formaldehyde dehydrogenase [Acetobacteraceae bacterium]|nr:glutathione-dependent formaldehyde dehydrogenase [Acetobacteraceae bacterium]
MKAVVFHAVGDIRLDDVPEPELQEPTDAIVRLTSSAICGTDLHFVRGTMAGMKPGTILGHEGVGVVQQLGPDVRNLNVGDRVVVCSTIACGACSYCRAGYYAQCDNANPNGKRAGTAFFGGPAETGPFNGLQAERARIPFAHVGLVKLPDDVSDDQAILLSDIFPTGYFGADLAEVSNGDTVAVFGCGPVGQFAIASAWLKRASRVIAVDKYPDRLEMARRQGAETVDFEREDPVATILRLTGEIGVDRVIDAVGVDAMHAHHGPAAKQAKQNQKQFQQEQQQVAPEQNPQDGNWVPGDAPSQALRWAVECIAKAGTLGIIGVYPPQMQTFPIGMAMNKNLAINAGNCHHRRYVPRLVELVRTGAVDPVKILSKVEPMQNALEAYRAFDQREPGWLKVELKPRIAAE